MAKKTAAPEAETGTEIAPFVIDNPVAVLTDPKKFDDLVGKIEAEVEAHVPDLTTAKGRAAIKSLAYKVVRTKTALDDAGKELNAEKRKQIDAVDEVRRDVRSKLDALADKARRPLDEWEAQEEERRRVVTGKLELIDYMVSEGQGPDADSAYIAHQISELESLEFDSDLFQGALEIAVAKKISALDTLRNLLARAQKAEADAAELAELRKANAEREAREAEEKAERDRQEQVKRDEEQRQREAEEAEAKRIADIKAAEEKAAADAREATAREAQAKIDEANREAKALREAEEARQAEARKQAEEQAARDADKAHKSAVLKSVKESIMSTGDIAEHAAKAIVLAIVAGQIPNVTLRF